MRLPPTLENLRARLWSEPRPVASGGLGRWPAWLMLAGILALVAAVNADHLRHNPFPRPSSHRTWRLVPQLIHHLQGYPHHSPGGPGTTFLGGTGCYYSLDGADPIPWTSPSGLVHELGPEGRLYQLWGACPEDFFTCMPHAYVLPAAVGAMFPGHALLVAMVPTFAFLVLLVGLYGIGVEVADRRAGVAAAAIAAGYPGLFGFARWPEGYLQAAALATVMVWCLLRSRGLTRALPLLGFTLLAWSARRAGPSRPGSGCPSPDPSWWSWSGGWRVRSGRGACPGPPSSVRRRWSEPCAWPWTGVGSSAA